MNRISKILAIVLLLALCLSTLGIFSAFAEEAAESDLGYVEVFNQWENPAGLTQASTGETWTRNEEKGYYTLSFASDSPLAAGTDYVSIMYPQVDSVNTQVATNGSTDKNTDYLVLDFDISTNGDFVDSVYFHTRWAAANAKGYVQYSTSYFELNGNNSEEFYIDVHEDKSDLYAAPATTPGEWINVTIIYDFSNNEAAEPTYAQYIYIDGVYAGKLSIALTGALSFQTIRLSSGAQTLAGTSTNFANFTMRSYKAGYDGPMAEAGALGVAGVTLNNLPDLAYTQENVPGAEGNSKLATITRGDETIDAYSFDDLDASLRNGDVVTLYKNLTRPIVVDSNISVTFKDDNGNVLTPGARAEGDLVQLPALAALDFSAGGVVVRNRKDGSGAKVVADLATAVADTKSKIYTLLGDTSAAVANLSLTNPVFDANGYTLTLSPTADSLRFFKQGASVTFKNGKLVLNGHVPDLTTATAASRVIFENLDIEVNNIPTIVDQRGGIVIFKNCENIIRNVYSGGTNVSRAATIISEKAGGDGRSTVRLDNSNIKSDNLVLPEGHTWHKDTGAPISINNVSSNGKRQGSMHCYVEVINGSEIISNGFDAISADAHANSTGTANDDGTYTQAAAYAKNENYVRINVIDSKIVTNYRVASIGISTFYAGASLGSIAAEQFSYNVDVNVHNSDIDAYSLLYTTRPANKNVPADLDYVYNVNTNITGTTSIDVDNALIYRTYSDGVTLNIADGVKLSDDAIVREGNTPVVPTLGDGSSVIAYSSLTEGYNYVVTSDYREGSYNVKKGEEVIYSVPFFWNSKDAAADPSVIAKVVDLPAATTEYSYTAWANDGDNYTTTIVPAFKLSANLTALSDFDLNVYLSAGVNTDKITMTIDGNKVADFQAINIAGVDYLKVEDGIVKGITPELVEGEHVVVVSFVGGFGETVELTANVSAAKHLVKALNGEGKAFAQAIINYVAAANAYEDKTVAIFADKVTDVVAPDYSDAKWDGALAGVTAKLNLGDSVRWVFSTESEDTFTVTYAGGTRKFTAADGEIVIGVRAYNLLEDITITNDATGETLTLNLAGYHNKLTDAKAQAVVDAMYQYGAAAKAYAGK